MKLPYLKYRRLRGDLLEVINFVNDETEKKHLVDTFEFNAECRSGGHNFNPRTDGGRAGKNDLTLGYHFQKSAIYEL